MRPGSLFYLELSVIRLCISMSVYLPVCLVVRLSVPLMVTKNALTDCSDILHECPLFLGQAVYVYGFLHFSLLIH